MDKSEVYVLFDSVHVPPRSNIEVYKDFTKMNFPTLLSFTMMTLSVSLVTLTVQW